MFLGIGLVTGLLLGLTGAGGSVFAVPLLLLLTSLNPADATGLSLAAVAAGAAYGSVMHSRRGRILIAPTIILALGGLTTAPLGRWLATLMTDVALLLSFCAVAIVIAAWMWVSATSRPEAARVVRSHIGDADGQESDVFCPFSESGQFQLKPRCMASLFSASLVIGLMSGLLGVGGGFMIVPALLIMSRASMQQAVGSSLLIITAVSSVGFASHLWLAAQPRIDLLLQIISGSLIGMILSQRVSRFISGPLLQKAFAVALIAISLLTLFWRSL